MILPTRYYLMEPQTIDAGLTALKDAVFAEIIEGTLTLKDAIKLLLSVAVGKTSVAGSTFTFRDTTDATDRVVATVTSSERTSVTLDVG